MLVTVRGYLFCFIVLVKRGEGFLVILTKFGLCLCWFCMGSNHIRQFKEIIYIKIFRYFNIILTYICYILI